MDLGLDAALSGADAAALDALVSAGWEAAAVGAEERERAGRIAAVLSELQGAGGGAGAEGNGGEGSTLMDVVLLRVARLREQAEAARVSGPGGGPLSPADGAALDSLVEAGFDARRTPAEVRPRAVRQEQLLSLVTAGPVPSARDRDRLLERTVAVVERWSDRESEGMRFENEVSRARGRRVQLADLVSVAALLLIGTAVVWPMLTGAIEYNRRLACQANLEAAGLGFGLYARDSRDVLPMASASPKGNPWWQVGRGPERSNAANLYTLVRTGYTKLDELSCLGNPTGCRCVPGPGSMDWAQLGEVSYSYRIMFGRVSSTLAQSPDGILLADRSPMRIVGNQLTIFPFWNTVNHGGKGQNVLQGDGKVQWMTSPVRPNGDNIWLPRFVETLVCRAEQAAEGKPIQGTETPAADEDAFVGPGSTNDPQASR